MNFTLVFGVAFGAGVVFGNTVSLFLLLDREMMGNIAYCLAGWARCDPIPFHHGWLINWYSNKMGSGNPPADYGTPLQ